MPKVIQMTHHAKARSQQRAINSQTIGVILDFGREIPSFRNRSVVFMDKAARRRAKEALGRAAYAKIEARLDAAIVIANSGIVITCVYRRSRIYRAA